MLNPLIILFSIYNSYSGPDIASDTARIDNKVVAIAKYHSVQECEEGARLLDEQMYDTLNYRLKNRYVEHLSSEFTQVRTFCLNHEAAKAVCYMTNKCDLSGL